MALEDHHKMNRNRRILVLVILAGLAILLGGILTALPAIGSRQVNQAFLDRQEIAVRPEFAADLQILETVPRYSLRAIADPARGSLFGELNVRYTHPGPDPLPDLVFRLYPNAASIYGGGSIEVDSITQEGQPVDFELSQDRVTLTARLPRRLTAGQSVDLDLRFLAQAPADTISGYGIFSRSQGVLALAAWYPVLAPYEDGWQTPPIPAVGDAMQADVSLYDVELSVPPGWDVISTGAVVSTTTLTATLPLTDSRVAPTWVNWQMASGPAREFAAVVVQGFSTHTLQADGVTLRLHTVESPEDSLTPQAGLEALATAYSVYNELFGPYPLSELDVVEKPITIGGYEFSGMVIVDADLRQHGSLDRYAYLLAHELAHQWWYNLVGTPTVDEPWLDEGHATYAAQLYFERSGQEQAAQSLLASWQAEAGALPVTGSPGQDETPQPDPTAPPGSQPALPGTANSALAFSGWDPYRQAVYSRGALFLHALRRELGDERFFELLRRFQQDYRYRQATTADYRDLAEQLAGKDLDSFFDAWLEPALQQPESTTTP